MQTRSTTWVNIDTLTAAYRIKIKHPERGWINAGDGNGMFKFDTEKEREEKRAELRKIKPEWMRKAS